MTLLSLFALFSIAFVAQAEDWVHEPCVDWESTAAAYNEAFAQWNPPPCYTFSFTFLGLLIEPPNYRTVVYGKSLPDGDERYGDLQTLDDFWNMYEDECIQECPTKGANSCSMDYAMSDDGIFFHPTFLTMDMDSRFIHDAYTYSIENVRVIDCPVEEGATESDETHEKKKDKKKLKKNKKKLKKGKKNNKKSKGKLLHKREY